MSGDGGTKEVPGGDGGSCAQEVRAELEAVADREAAPAKARFFKAVPGGYGEGDEFLGISVPKQRRIAKRHYRTADIHCIEELLTDRRHEVRLTALFMMVHKYEKAGAEDERRRLYELYARRIEFINNWDLIDSSAPHVLGAFLLEHPEEQRLLRQWAESDHLWRRRAAVLATFTFIRSGRYEETLELARLLLGDSHDLMHKAVGWMLREVGNRAPEVEYAFLDEHAAEMPRTMLRYAIEKLPEERRRRYMGK